MKKFIIKSALITVVLLLANLTRGLSSGCGCYVSGDCTGKKACGNYGGCTVKKGGCAKDCDGTCTFSIINPYTDVTPIVLAYKHRLLAYEIAGETGGGVPDSNLIKVAESFDISPENKEAIRWMVIHIVSMYAGKTVKQNLIFW